MKKWSYEFVEDAAACCASCGNTRNHGVSFKIKFAGMEYPVFICVVCFLPIIRKGVDFLEKIENTKVPH